MKLLNKGPSPRYCQLARCTVQSGCATRELDSFTKAFESVLELSKGFEIILSDADVRLLAELCSKYLVPLVSNGRKDLEKMAGVGELVRTLKDPTGVKSIRDKAHETVRAMQKMRERAAAAQREAEARVNAESNYIGPDGNPVPKPEIASSDLSVDVDNPVVHEEMTTDLKSIIENNLAVMTTASGKRIENREGPHTVVAAPGGTPVPTDPKYYQKIAAKSVPGKPDLPR